jgi:hypothetical protein
MPSLARQREVGAQQGSQKFGQGRNKKGVSMAKRLGRSYGWLLEKSKSMKSQTIQGLAQSCGKKTKPAAQQGKVFEVNRR